MRNWTIIIAALSFAVHADNPIRDATFCERITLVVTQAADEHLYINPKPFKIALRLELEAANKVALERDLSPERQEELAQIVIHAMAFIYANNMKDKPAWEIGVAYMEDCKRNARRVRV